MYSVEIKIFISLRKYGFHNVSIEKNGKIISNWFYIFIRLIKSTQNEI